MKKISLLTLVMLLFLLQVQPAKASDPMTFYGVDYSLVKVYGADESPTDLISAFDAINNLFITEFKKYNPEKAFKTKNMNMSLAMVRKKINSIDPEKLKIDSNRYEFNENDIRKLIRSYNTGADEGVGAVLVGVLLDKGENQGTYRAVTFDIRTKQIISNKLVSGQAKGFGLRNFWARSVLESLNKLAKSKN